MILITLIWLSLAGQTVQECIRFEFHEKIETEFGQSELVRAMCLGKGGSIVDYSLGIFRLNGPLIFNVTFHCCAPSACLSDHDCPINFNCKSGFCSVAECTLTDEPEIILQEGRECFIDDDCYFEIPNDSDNWKCLPDPWCFHNKTCDISYNFCKRCSTGYINPDPKRFTAADGSIKPPTTSPPWWLNPPTTTISPDLTLNSPFENFFRTNSDPSLPNATVPEVTDSPFSSSDRFLPSSLPSSTSTTPNPDTLVSDDFKLVDEISSSYNYTGSGFDSSDIPINLSDAELISNVSFIDLARIDSTDSYEDSASLNESTTSTPQPLSTYSPTLPPLPQPPAVPIPPLPVIYSSAPSSRPRTAETADPFFWPGFFAFSELNRTRYSSNIRHNINEVEVNTTSLPHFTEINSL